MMLGAQSGKKRKMLPLSLKQALDWGREHCGVGGRTAARRLPLPRAWCVTGKPSAISGPSWLSLRLLGKRNVDF